MTSHLGKEGRVAAVLPYYLPRGQRASDRRFLAAELRALAGRLAEISGLMPEPMSILDALDSAGVTEVADDLACLGCRLYQPSQAKDPYLRMAEGLLSGAPDSTRGVSIEARAEHLIRLAKDRGARGLIFFLVKFCEPEQFYLPQLQKRFNGENLRSMMVEVHIGETLPDRGPVARVYMHPILNRGTGHKLKTVRRMVDDFGAHGVILLSEEQTDNRLMAFLEMLTP